MVNLNLVEPMMKKDDEDDDYWSGQVNIDIEIFKDEAAYWLVKEGFCRTDDVKAFIDHHPAFGAESDLSKGLMLHDGPYCCAMSIIYESPNGVWRDHPEKWFPENEYVEHKRAVLSGEWTPIYFYDVDEL